MTGSLSDHDFSLCGYFAVELLRLVRHCYGQLFLVAIDSKIGRYTPRVPAGARSAKGHDALGHDVAVCPRYHHLLDRATSGSDRNSFSFAAGSYVVVSAAFGSSAGGVFFAQPDKANPSTRMRDNRIQLALRRDAFIARFLTFFAKCW